MTSKQSTDNLISLPLPEFDECFSSWLTRSALTQGASLAEFAFFLSIDISGDVDFDVRPEQIYSVKRRLGLPPNSFVIAQEIILNLKEIVLRGSSFLLRGGSGSQFRVCPHCLDMQVVNYVPIHWRFDIWKHCPLHLCAMQDKCEKCLKRFFTPASLLDLGRRSNEVPSVGYCGFCGAALNGSKVNSRHELAPLRITLQSRAVLFLAALKNGHLSLASKALCAKLNTDQIFKVCYPVSFLGSYTGARRPRRSFEMATGYVVRRNSHSIRVNENIQIVSHINRLPSWWRPPLRVKGKFAPYRFWKDIQEFDKEMFIHENLLEIFLLADIFLLPLPLLIR